ncbi:DUF4349 domain-containing protein [Brevibacillus sp. SYSU BS000544]|uniref:DUF4349 domain-containing protein n=1 Tax=Brevibacillus sp. SYSU BS000544 TaxID=3416443 RepID=UPI003CE59C0B
MTKRKHFLSWHVLMLFTLAVSLLLSGCGSSSQNAPSGGESAQKFASRQDSASLSASNTSSVAPSPASSENEAPAEPMAAPTEAKAAGSPSTSGILQITRADRKMIYQANLSVEVENYTKARSELEVAVSRYHGYILNSSDFENEYEKGGQLNVRIPQTGFSSFLNELDKIATKIPGRSIVGQDVTEEYVDLSSRLKARQVVEARLLQFMSEAKKTEDLLKISSELGRVQEEIEQIKGRMRYLDENIAYSTIEMSLTEKKVTAKLDEVADSGTWNKAWLALNKSLLGILAFLNGLIVFVAGAFPLLLLFAIIAIPVVVYIKRKRRTPPPSQPTSSSND